MKLTPSAGARVTSLAKSGSSALRGDVTLSQGSNITLTQVGQDIAIASSASGSAVVVKDEGTTLTSAVAQLDFVGAGVTATTSGNNVTVTVPGAGTATITTQEESSTLSSSVTTLNFVGTAYTASGSGSTTTITSDADVDAIASLPATAGMLARTGAGAFSARTLASADGSLAVTNPTGAAGNPDFQVKKSTVDWAFSGTLTPPQLTADVNDYNPTGFSSATVIRLDGDGNSPSAYRITGLAGGSAGLIKTFINLGTNVDDVTFSNDDAGSVAANRFEFDNDFTLRTSEQLTLQYDAVSSRWRADSLSNDVGLTPQFYGSNHQVPILDIDFRGRVLSASNTEISIPASDITSGTLAVARGGTGLGSLGSANTVLNVNGAGSALEYDKLVSANCNATTGTGDTFVFQSSPALTAPNLGTPSAAVLSNATGLPISTGVSGLAANVATFLATPSSANLISAMTDETGTGACVFATSPSLVTPLLGTPTSGTLTNCTGLPVSTGVSGLGTGIATFLATPSSANLASAVTDETGSGALVFASGPTLSGTPLAPTAANGTNTTQLATTAYVLATKLNQLTAPSASVSLNSQLLTNVLDPVSSQDAATKNYVDSVAQGLDTKAPVRAATTIAGTLITSFANGQIIDGVTLTTGDRILVKNQVSSAENGIYVVSVAGSPVRATDMDAWAEVPDAFTFVEEGTINADTGWVCTSNAGGTLNTTAITLVQFSGAGTYTAGTGLTLTGTQFAIDSTVATLAGSQTLTNKTLTSPTLTTPVLGTPSSGTLTSCTGLPVSTGISGLGSGVATFLATPSSANLISAVTDETGTGALVFATTPTLVTPILGTPTSGTLTSCTGLPISTGVSGLGTGVATFLATPSSANLLSAVTDETGTGALVFATSPTLVTPLLGTPTSGTLTNCTGLPISTGVSGLGSNVAAMLATFSSANIATACTDETGSGLLVFATSPSLTTPLLGTPTSGTLTNCTGLPISTGVSGLASGVATFLATPSSANLISAVTDETGTGALVFATSPSLVTPLLGTPTSGTLTNCTAPASLITSGQLALARGGTNADLSGTGGASQVLKQVSSGAAVTVGQLAFSDISGSVTDAQVPDTITLSALSQITTRAHASLQSLSADDHSQYALLTGRTGNSNDLLLSTTQSGSLYGSAANGVNGCLNIYANNQGLPSKYSLYQNYVNFPLSGLRAWTLPQMECRGVYVGYAIGKGPPSGTTFTMRNDPGASRSAPAFYGFAVDDNTTVVWEDNGYAVESAGFYGMATLFKNGGTGTRTLGPIDTLVSGLTLQADTNPLQARWVGGLLHSVSLTVNGTGTGSFANGTGTGDGVFGLIMGGSFATGWTVPDWCAVRMAAPTGSGGTGTTVAGVYLEDIGDSRFTNKYSLLSKGSGVSLVNAGPVRIGDTTTPTEKLEVVGNQVLTGALYGGNGSGDSLLVQSTSHATKGDVVLDDAVQFWPSVPDFVAGSGGTVSVERFDATYIANPTNVTHTLRGYYFAPTVTTAGTGVGSHALTGIELSPAITAGANLGYAAIKAGGTLTNNAAPVFGNFGLFSSTMTLSSTAASTAPYLPIVYSNGTTIQYDVSSGSATLNFAYGFTDIQTLKNVQAGGTFTVTDLVSYRSFPVCNEVAGTLNVTRRVGFDHGAIGVASTSPAITTDVFADIADTKIAAVTTALSMRSAGSAVEMRHAGPAYFGLSTAAPSALIHVAQQTINNEVLRLESVATNDDPNYVVRQYRATTTDATVTTLGSITLSASTTTLIEARVVARRTGGSSGTAEDGIAVVVRGAYNVVGGNATALTNGTPSITFESDSQSAMTATLDTSSGTVRIRVTGAANNNMTWHGTAFVQTVGS